MQATMPEAAVDTERGAVLSELQSRDTPEYRAEVPPPLPPMPHLALHPLRLPLSTLHPLPSPLGTPAFWTFRPLMCCTTHPEDAP
eukprot:737530-Prorocentrum_minimum.AAC.1